MPASSSSTKAGYRPGVAQQPYTKWDADKDEIEVDYKQMDDSGKPATWFSGRKGVVLKLLLAVVVFCLGLIIGYVLRRSVHEYIMTGGHCAYTDGYQGYSADLSAELKERIHAKHIEKNLRNYTSDDHITGTHNNNLLRDRLREQMEGYGLDVRLASYKALLSTADWERPNTVSLLDSNDTVVYETKFRGPEEFRLHPELMHAYNAFSPNGTITGDIVYAGFGEMSNFAKLAARGVNVTGKIVLMRLGRLYKGQMVKNAEDLGAIGVLLYSDPAEVVGLTTHLEDTYDKSWWLPGWAVQRGTVLPSIHGDPSTPGLPSTEGMYRLKPEEIDMPRIPVQPIGYDDAHDIMLNMSGIILADTQGAHLASIDYKSGPGYEGDRKGWKVRLSVHNELYESAITNVVGVITGKEEPDRYVIVGCHYDAWTFGAVDPGSGTAILMELAKAFGELKKHGWQPRRTIMFVHWDAEEQALMGSYEFVEEHQKELADRTVAYINLDVAVRGNHSLDVQASPMLRAMIRNISEMFPSATSSEALFNEWRRNTPRGNDPSADLPEVWPIGGGSDQAAFVYLLGVSAIWPRYTFKSRKDYIRTVPGYHTAIDSFDYVKRFVDPDFRAHESLAWVVGELVLELTTFTRLPLDVRELSATLEDIINGLQASLINQHALKGKYLSSLIEAVGNFTIAAAEFHDRFIEVHIENVLQTRAINDKVLRVSQAFIHPEGLPRRPAFKNILFAPSAVDGSTCRAFTGICDALSELSNAPRSDQPKYEPELLRQISIATLAVRSAANILTDDILKPTNHG